MKPRGLLMIEHRLIEKVLLLIKDEIECIKANDTVDPYFIQSVVDFIRTYADRTHHGKEEDIMFEQLKTKAMSPEDLAIMAELAAEHDNARDACSKLNEAETALINGDKSQVIVIRETLAFLVNLYPDHIAKEDKIFFPNTEHYFTDEEQTQMLEEFYTFDRQMIHEKYNKLYESLKRNPD